jgi:hypothetical protein
MLLAFLPLYAVLWMLLGPTFTFEVAVTLAALSVVLVALELLALTARLRISTSLIESRQYFLTKFVQTSDVDSIDIITGMASLLRIRTQQGIDVHINLVFFSRKSIAKLIAELESRFPGRVQRWGHSGRPPADRSR